MGQATFIHAAAKEWNDLPTDHRNCSSLKIFKTKLFLNFFTDLDKTNHKCGTIRATNTTAALTAYHFRRLLQLVRFLQHVQDVIIDIIIFQAVTSRQAKEKEEDDNSSIHTCL